MGVLFDHYGEVMPTRTHADDLYQRASLENLLGHQAMSIVRAIAGGDLDKAIQIATEIADDHYARSNSYMQEAYDNTPDPDPAWVEDAQEDPTLPDHP